MKTIHKYLLHGTSETKFVAPVGAQILSTGCQGKDQLVVWVELDPSIKDTQIYNISVYGTGWELPDNPGRFIATVIDSSGFVWHIYEASWQP